MPEGIEINFRLTLDDYLSAGRSCKMHVLHAKVVGILALVALGAGMLHWFYFGYSIPALLLVGLSTYVLLDLFAQIVLTDLVSRVAVWDFPEVRAELNEPNETRFVVTETHVSVTTKNGEHTDAWSPFDKVVESDHLYTFLRAKTIMAIVPKRAFRSPEDEAAFRSLISRKVSRIYR